MYVAYVGVSDNLKKTFSLYTYIAIIFLPLKPTMEHVAFNSVKLSS